MKIVISTIVLDRTQFGRYLYAMGGNAEAARRSGVKVRWIKWWAFVICSSLAVFPALLSVSRVGSVDATVGRDIVLSGVAAAVVAVSACSAGADASCTPPSARS